MAILPGLDEMVAEYGFTDSDKRCIAASQYVISIFFMIVLAWLSYNIWTILIKQRKYRVLPLLTFYIVATLLVLNRLYSSIWFSFALVYDSLIAFLGP